MVLQVVAVAGSEEISGKYKKESSLMSRYNPSRHAYMSADRLPKSGSCNDDVTFNSSTFVSNSNTIQIIIKIWFKKLTVAGWHCEVSCGLMAGWPVAYQLYHQLIANKTLKPSNVIIFP
jgi:hypothetical protein